MSELWSYLNSPSFTRLATWSAIYSLLIICLATVVYMVKLGPKILLDWGYVWIMGALAIVLVRLIYLNQRGILGSSFWGAVIWLDLALACGFTLWVLIRNGYQLIREGES